MSFASGGKYLSCFLANHHGDQQAIIIGHDLPGLRYRLVVRVAKK